MAASCRPILTAEVPGTMLSDTSPDARRVQIELLRRLTPAQRVSMMRSLSATAIGLSRRALARTNPGLDGHELNLLFIEMNYGKELADGVRRDGTQPCRIRM